MLLTLMAYVLQNNIYRIFLLNTLQHYNYNTFILSFENVQKEFFASRAVSFRVSYELYDAHTSTYI